LKQFVCVVFFLITFVFLGPEVSSAQESSDDDAPPISYNLKRNQYFLESLRLKSLSNLAIIEGEYEQAETYADEAIRYAQLSDEFIAARLLRKRALNAIADASGHIRWAEGAQAPRYYPNEFKSAKEHYAQALDAETTEDWDSVLEYALMVEQDLANVAAPPPKGEIPPGMPKSPTQYTVRPWDIFGDCFWNIAEWFYKDHYKWPILYEANKDKIPDPDNPNLIDVGTVIDIPSVNGELREGIWDSGRPYKKPDQQ
jgi:nucleoid-associated protein YgaU